METPPRSGGRVKDFPIEAAKRQLFAQSRDRVRQARASRVAHYRAAAGSPGSVAGAPSEGDGWDEWGVEASGSPKTPTAIDHEQWRAAFGAEVAMMASVGFACSEEWCFQSADEFVEFMIASEAEARTDPQMDDAEQWENDSIDNALVVHGYGLPQTP